MQLIKSGTIITQRFNIYLATIEESGFIDSGDIEMLERVVKLLTRKPGGSRAGGWHPSQLHQCPRAQVFGFLGIPGRERINPGLQHVFNDGHWRHVRWQIALLQAGLLTEVEVPVHNKRERITGHLDGVNTKEMFTFELKGIHTMQFKHILDAPKAEHLLQVHGYFLATGFSTGVIVYEDKASNNWHEHVISTDATIMSMVRTIIEDLNAHIDQKTLPQVLDDCRAQKGPTYRDCAYSYLCLRSTWKSATQAAAQSTTEDALAVTVKLTPRKRLRVRQTTTGS
jgi:hypothetical protein